MGDPKTCNGCSHFLEFTSEESSLLQEKLAALQVTTVYIGACMFKWEVRPLVRRFVQVPQETCQHWKQGIFR
jgi:hypothetical protein